MLYVVSQSLKINLERTVMCISTYMKPCLKGATVKRKNMLLKESLFFLKVAYPCLLK